MPLLIEVPADRPRRSRWERPLLAGLAALFLLALWPAPPETSPPAPAALSD